MQCSRNPMVQMPQPQTVSASSKGCVAPGCWKATCPSASHAQGSKWRESIPIAPGKSRTLNSLLPDKYRVMTPHRGISANINKVVLTRRYWGPPHLNFPTFGKTPWSLFPPCATHRQHTNRHPAWHHAPHQNYMLEQEVYQVCLLRPPPAIKD